MMKQVKKWVAAGEAPTSSSSSDPNQPPRTSRKTNSILASILASTLLIAFVVTIIGGLRNSYDRVSPQAAASHTIIRATCSSTRFPKLCFETVEADNVTSQKDVIEASLNITIDVVRRNFFAIQKLRARKGLTPREKIAPHDCLETIDETLDKLHKAYVDLELYPSKKSIRDHAEDLKMLLSAAMTNQETCLDGFSHDDADKKVRKALEPDKKHVEKMCSNVLAMITNMTDTDMSGACAAKMENLLESLFQTTVHVSQPLLQTAVRGRTKSLFKTDTCPPTRCLDGPVST
uniref:pectinesterase n=1 Tax=Kalanchoe fedtschenkoi TaxID=63787 RepID=A0A7N0UQX8_KALFE